MDRDLTPHWGTLIDRYVAYEGAVNGLAPETLRHRELYLATFARWWQSNRPGDRAEQASTIYREVELAGQGADVPGRHFPHRWRHTYATELVLAGIDIHLVQRLLGHRSVISTVGYTHLAIDDLKGAIGTVWT